ncbi:45411_t:CDS:2 [Gigaspora margarita]|uniref:45411_t:CDS:1 n=1 Tax=Gigaspora margarita TaxID=4874 RepID=A0ABN7VGI0_GIGMA|nr:45411_t:CDS:2 [Gigaspora margarita]
MSSSGSNGSSSKDSTTPINIPENTTRRRRGSENITSFGQSLADTWQSLTGNYSYTASTYMSANMVVPTSFVGENIEQGAPGSQYSSILSNQYYSPQTYQSDSYLPGSHYGSSLMAISESLYEGDYLGTSYASNILRPPADGRRRQPITMAERTPLLKTPGGSIHNVPITIPSKALPVVIGSTFRQSVFNSCNILIGIGILALPFGFKHAGWVIGLSLFFFCLGVTNYTAKVLAKCLEYDARLCTYADMGAIAFGERTRLVISTLFSLELIASATALVILVGDSLHELFPTTSLITLKVIAWMVMTPLTLIAIRYLSYFSLLGILSATSLVTVMMVDGFMKPEHPGSLFDPMKTNLWPDNWGTVPISFGLIMAGFTGHAVFPTVYRDMKRPDQYPKMVNITYELTTVVYFLMAACGYLMFGNETRQEITQNIMDTPGYWKPLNQFVIWLVAINPIAKYALTLNPINLTLEIYYHSVPSVENWFNSGRGRRTGLRVLTRMLVSTIVVFIAIRFPEFERVMGVLGSFFSFMISAIFPCVCHLKLFGHELSWKEWLFNWVIILICSVLSAFGTTWAIMPNVSL